MFLINILIAHFFIFTANLSNDELYVKNSKFFFPSTKLYTAFIISEGNRLSKQHVQSDIDVEA